MSFTKTLAEKKFKGTKDGRWIVVTAHITHIQGNKQPHFSITGESGDYINEVCKRADSFGCLHDEIKEILPELSKYIPFHLCDNDGTPMYYYENSLYHLKEGKFEYFKSSCLYGILESDYIFQPEALGDYARMFLNSRLENVQNEYKKAMSELFG